MKRLTATLTVALALALAGAGCAVSPKATERNAHEWRAVRQAVENGTLTTDDPTLTESWLARIRAAEKLADEIHAANTGDDDAEPNPTEPK